MTARRIVVMGVAGCGKSSVAALLAKRIGGRYVDGDTLHSQSNIDKMAAGIPLTDADRWPWLKTVGDVLKDEGTVIACSALKRAYRDVIREHAGAEVTFLYLKGSREVLLERMATRQRHFMPVSLLDSQLQTLEEPGPDERAITIGIEPSVPEIVAEFVKIIAESKA